MRAASRTGSGDCVDAVMRTPSAPCPSRPIHGPGHGIDSRSEAERLGAEPLGQRALARVRVDAQHLAAVGAQHLHRQQSDEAETGHHHALAQCGRKQADTLQADGADDGERGGCITHPVGNLGTQVVGHHDPLGMRAIGHHAVANPETGGIGAPVLANHTHMAIAQRQGLVEFAAHRIQCGEEPVRPDFVDHLPDFFRLLPRLLDPTRSSKLDQHALGAKGHERPRGIHQQGPGTWTG